MPTLPPLTLGLDVVTPEGSLPKGAVRAATNLVLGLDGSFSTRPGYSVVASLANAHSYWRSPAQTRVLAAADDTLYDVDPVTGAAAALFVGLSPGERVSYVDLGPTIYFACAGVLRKIEPDGSVRRPGIADLWGSKPTLTQTLGGLLPGRYGVAYSLVNDLGEESPVSSVEWIDVTTGGVTLSALQTAADVVSVRLYITSADGTALRHHDTRPYATSTSIVDQTVKRIATRTYKQPMPGGNFVRKHNGRLYTVDGNWVSRSDALDPDVSDLRFGGFSLARTINVFEPVDGGIFVALRERTVFLRAEGEKFNHVPVSARGALWGSSTTAPADFFSPELAPDRDRPVAVWLTEVGIAIGRPDGTIAYPQADRIRITGEAATPLVVQVGGIKQVVFCVESLALGPGVAVDQTI